MSMDIAVMEVLMKAPKMRTMVLKEYMRQEMFQMKKNWRMQTGKGSILRGDFAQKGNTNAKTVKDVPDQGSGEGSSIEKEKTGWKKRLVIYKTMIHFITYLIQH